MDRHPISDEDRARIRTAIERAEARTAGEIYVVVARQSGDYRLIPLLWASLVALAAPLPFIAFTRLAAGIIYLIQLALFMAIGLVLSLPSVWPRIVPRSVFRDRAHARSVEQFVAHGVDTTDARTGALIYVSLAERTAEVIADTGIAAKVDPAVWDEIIASLTAEIAAGHMAEGLIGAIERLGAILAEHFPVRPGDRNELVNDVVFL